MHPKTRNFLRSINNKIADKFLDLMALIIAIAAVVISIIQTNTQKKLEILNKQPLLLIEFLKVDAEPKKGFLIKNVGFGPAVVKSFKYYLNQEDYKKNIGYHEWLDSKGNGRFPMECCFDDINYLEEGYIITTDLAQPLFLLGTDTAKFYYSPTAKYMDSVIIEIEYQSISPFDDHIYFLKFCEIFLQNNIRSRTEKNIYETNAVEGKTN